MDWARILAFVTGMVDQEASSAKLGTRSRAMGQGQQSIKHWAIEGYQ
jgi:hypothetical protein